VTDPDSGTVNVSVGMCTKDMKIQAQDQDDSIDLKVVGWVKISAQTPIEHVNLIQSQPMPPAA
jgi:hypothetical protein